MRDYINKVLEDLQHLLDGQEGTSVTLATEYLFKINENCKKLNTEAADHLHHVVAQLSFLCKQGCPDIKTGVAFLTTRVKGLDEDNLQKLKRVIRYFSASKDLVLTLECKDATNQDFKSHTGGMLSIRKGCLYSTSMKQQLNTKRSTEA